MANGFVQVPPDSTGKQIDCESLGAGLVRQRVETIQSGTALVAGAVSITGGQVSVTGSVAISNNLNISNTPSVILAAGTSNFGTLNNISRTVAVTGTVQLVAGTANIGTLNNISAAVTTVPGPVAISGTASVVITNFLAGSGQSINVIDTANTALRVNVVAGAGGGANPVSIAAGTSNIGFINNISAAVVVTGLSGTAVAVNVGNTVTVTGQVSVTGAVAISNTSFLVSLTGTAIVQLAAGTNNIGTIQAISAQVAVSGSVNIINSINISAMPNVVLAAGANEIGSIKGISSTINIAPSYLNAAPAIPSASRGPLATLVSSTAIVVVAPGAGFAIHVNRIMVTNGGASMTRASFFQGSVSASGDVGGFCAANGGGYTIDFNPPYRVQSNTALLAKMSPSTSGLVTIHFYVAP